MEIKKLLDKSREIWGRQGLTLSEVIVRMGKVFGDICRWERNAIKDQDVHSDYDLKKELGNVIFSTIKWCDELGYDPEECVQIAIDVQEKSASKLKKAN